MRVLSLVVGPLIALWILGVWSLVEESFVDYVTVCAI